MIKLKDLYPNQASFMKEENINEAPDNELFKKLRKHQDEIYKLLQRFKSKANVPAVARSFMIGLNNQLKKDKMIESVNEELNSSAYSQLSRSIKAIAINVKDLAKAHKKQDDGVVRNEIDNLLYDVKRMVNIIGNKKYNESVNERSNPSDKKELLRALKNSKVADVFSLNNDELVIEMTSPSGENFVVGNIRKYKGD